jgi:hypothetical protein
MIGLRAKLPGLSVALAIIVAGTGGAFFGLFSCGGYIWHRYLFDLLVAVSTLCALVLWRPASGRVWKGVALVLGLVATYHIVEAAVAPIYWGVATPSEYLRSAVEAFQSGPCS